MLRVLSTSLLAAVIVAAPQASNADSSPVQMPGTDHWYQFVPTHKPWDEANQAAAAARWNGMSGHLVTITSTQENAFVASLTNEEAWIGARNIGPSGGSSRRYAWVAEPNRTVVFTSCASDYGRTGCDVAAGAFTSWKDDQPDRYIWPEGAEDAVEINGYGINGSWNDAPDWNLYGYIVEFEPQQAPGSGGSASTFTASSTFTAPSAGLYRVDLLGGGGGGGNQYFGYVAGGGGGGGAFASGVVRLLDGQHLDLHVGEAGAGALPATWSDGGSGGDSFASLDGVALITAGGGAGGGGASSSAGGMGGRPAFGQSDVLTQTIGFSGGNGSAARLSSVYHNGGEGGSAANTAGAGYDGTSSLCAWTGQAPSGRMPSGPGGRGYIGGYSNSVSGCDGVGPTMPWGIQEALPTPGGDFGGGGGGGHDWSPTESMRGAAGLAVVTPMASLPSVPRDVTIVAGVASATVAWSAPLSDGGSAIEGYTATSLPDGRTCTSQGLSCTVTGLTNRRSYTFTVTASNAVGGSGDSIASAEVTPLSPGFQAWATQNVLAVNSSTTIRVAQASPNAVVSITGATNSSVAVDAAGFARLVYTPAKAGIQKFTATYSARVGKKTTKYTATAQLYVPAVMAPAMKIKSGKAGKFSLQFMPPGASILIALGDGRTLSGTADASGKATFSPTFDTLGSVAYSVSVAGVAVSAGGLNVSK